MPAAEGVYFRKEDYASFWRRLVVDAVDLFAAGVGCLILGVAVTMALPPDWPALEPILAVSSAVAFGYFVLLKRTKSRPLGYRLGGVRIAGLDGETPSLSALTLRLMFAFLRPLNFFLALVWLGADPHRQALRDKFAETYVVKEFARPVGRGRLAHRYYEICFGNFLFREVEQAPPEKDAALPNSDVHAHR